MPGAADRTIHVFGAFDGATVELVGNNKVIPEKDWVGLHDAWGNLLQFTQRDNAMQIVAENPAHIRPVLRGGGEHAEVYVIIISRRTM